MEISNAKQLSQPEVSEHLKQGGSIHLEHINDARSRRLDAILPAHMKTHGPSSIKIDHNQREVYQTSLRVFDPIRNASVNPNLEERRQFRQASLQREVLTNTSPNTSGEILFTPSGPGEKVHTNNTWTFYFTTWHLTRATSRTPQFALEIINEVRLASANLSEIPRGGEYYYILTASSEISPPQTGIDTGIPIHYNASQKFYAKAISLQFESIDRLSNTRGETPRTSFGSLLYSQCQPKNSNPGSGVSTSHSTGFQYFTSLDFSIGLDLPSQKPFGSLTYTREISAIQSTDSSYTTSSDTEFLIASSYPADFQQFRPTWTRLATPSTSVGGLLGPRIGATSTWTTQNTIQVKNPSGGIQPTNAYYTTAGIDVDITVDYLITDNEISVRPTDTIKISIGSLNRFLPIPSESNFISSVTGLNGQLMSFSQGTGSLSLPETGAVLKKPERDQRTGLKVAARGPDSHFSLASESDRTVHKWYYAAPIDIYIKKLHGSLSNVDIPEDVNLYFLISAKRSNGTPITAPNLKIFEKSTCNIPFEDENVCQPQYPEDLVPVETTGSSQLYYWTLPSGFAPSFKSFLIMNDDLGTDMIIDVAIGHTQGTGDREFAIEYATESIFLRAPNPQN